MRRSCPSTLPERPRSFVVSSRALNAARTDFRVFLYIIWKHLGLPDPTPRQYEIAHYLQHGPRRKVIMAFRGVGKSWITSAYVLWLLWNDVDVKVLVVSASKERSDAFSIFTKRLLGEVEFLHHLAPDPRRGDRDSNVAFDVRGCTAAHAPSVKSVGITGQIAGSRADYIVGDDVEVPNNSETSTQREKLISRVAELGGAVLTPQANNTHGGCTFLGTYQVEDSLYNALEDRGYTLRIWPAQVPVDAARYQGRLAPGIMDAPPGSACDPDRFDNAELAERQVEYGAAGYALQFMLDTTPGDENKHPLKTGDFIVMDVDDTVAPDRVVWSGAQKHTLEHLPRVGLHGDTFQKPMHVSDAFSEYGFSCMYIDPSGRGKDQTTYAIVKGLNGVLFIPKRGWGAFAGGYDKRTLTALALLAKEHRVNEVVVESNFGDGMWTELFSPVLHETYRLRRDGRLHKGCSLEEENVTGQKELRIIDTLEPVLSAHRIVIDESLVKDITRAKERSLDVDAALKSGFYQMTRLTSDRGCLKYDDWMDALSGAVRKAQDHLGLNPRLQSKKRKADRIDKELKKFVENIRGRQPQKGWHDTL